MSDTSTTQPLVEVDAPALVPYPFGLFAAVPARPLPDPHAEVGVWWRSVACGQAGVTYGPCTVDAPEPVDPLDPNVVCGITNGRAFSVYAYSDESVGGAPLEQKYAAANAALLAGEQYAVEQTLWAQLLAATAETGVAGSYNEAVAMAEGLIADNYGGSPVLHMSRYTATMAHDVIVRNGSRLTSLLDSPVVAGGGYGPSPAVTGEPVTVIATGAVVVLRGEPVLVGRHVDRATNSISAVVARPYVIGWDCAVVRVTHDPA